MMREDRTGKREERGEDEGAGWVRSRAKRRCYVLIVLGIKRAVTVSVDCLGLLLSGSRRIR
jgi:hypothetical protein